jgi:hypothetical protein
MIGVFYRGAASGNGFAITRRYFNVIICSTGFGVVRFREKETGDTPRNRLECVGMAGKLRVDRGKMGSFGNFLFGQG